MARRLWLCWPPPNGKAAGVCARGSFPSPALAAGDGAPLTLSPQSLPQICGAGDGQAFASALRQLYTAVTLQEAKQARKRHHSGEEILGASWGRVGHPLGEPPSPENGSGDLEDAEGPAPAAETSGHPDPPPQSPEDETAPASEGATLTSSPAQKPRLPAAKAKPKKAQGLFG
ncbi:Non-homologous end-joining factor 1 [Aix galericulata]|nr:Non-homologous end-joining factor 1 [Aix galericulata]